MKFETTLEVLNSKIAEKEELIEKLYEEKDFGNAMLKLDAGYADSDWHNFTFHHINNREVYFYVSSDKQVKRFSWSSWSFSSIKEGELEETCNNSLEYLQQVTQMIEFIKSGYWKQEVTNACNYYNEVIAPHKEELRGLYKELESIKTLIKEEEKKSLKEEALIFFKENAGRKIELNRKWYYSAKNYTYELTIKGMNKNGTVKISIWADRDKNLKEEEYIQLYKVLTSYYVNHDYDADSNVFYYKLPVMKSEDQKMEIITKEEYQQIRRNS